MIFWRIGACGAAMVCACSPAVAQQMAQQAGPEVAVGVFRHGANFHPLGSRLTFPALPPGQFYDGSEENGTTDVQLGYRSAPLRPGWTLKPRLTAKVQVSTAGRTSFASVGAEWRQHVLKGRLYGQVGIGLSIHDGYRYTPDPFEPGLSDAEAWRRYDIYRHRTGFGSRVLFNPNASIGVRIDRRWAAELAWEHFSHHQWFSEQNPGIDHQGLRLIRTLGR